MRKRVEAIVAFLSGSLAEDWATKLLALAVAVAVWAWVQSGLTVDQRLRADVSYIWPDGLARHEEVPSSVALTVQGPQAQVRRLERERPVITVDLSDAPEGTSTVDYGALPIQGVPEAVRVVHVSPPSIDVRLERRSTRRLPVRVVLAGEIGSAWKLVANKATPSTVEISGPRSLVRALTDVPTEPIDITELKESRAVEVPLNLSHRALSVEGSPSVQVALAVEPVIAERHFPEASVTANGRGWQATPPTVHVVLSGPVHELDRLDAGRIRVVAHLPDPEPAARARVSGQGKDPGRLEVELPQSSSVKVKRIDPDAVVLEREP